MDEFDIHPCNDTGVSSLWGNRGERHYSPYRQIQGPRLPETITLPNVEQEYTRAHPNSGSIHHRAVVG